MKKILIVLTIYLLAISCSQEGAWDFLRQQSDVFPLLENYDHRIKITINNSAQNETFTDFPVLVILNPGRITYSNVSADGSGIKFISSDLSEELPYEVESWNPGGESVFWVKIPSIPASSNSEYFWLYYSTESNSNNTHIADVWSNNYLAVWHMNDLGNPIKDSGINGLDGTGGITPPQQPPAAAVGRIAGAQEFDGILDGITVTNAAVLDSRGPVTFSFWMLDNGFTNLDYILKKGGLVIRLWDPFSIRFRVKYDTDSVASQFDNVWTQSVWKFFSITWTGTNNYTEASIFADGIQLLGPDTYSNGIGNRISDAGTDFIIGSDESGANSFKGKIDEMRISDVVRSPAWIRAQYLSMTDAFLTFGPEEDVSN